VIRLLLCDDQRLMREGMRTLLSLEPDLAVVGEAGDGETGVAEALRLKPDVVLMDIRMPGMNGVEATKRIRAALPATKVLILTTFDDDELVLAALLEGAAGYLTKDLPAEEIAAAIHQVQGGGVVMPPPIAAKVVAELARRQQQGAPAATAGGPDPAAVSLTEREREVLQLLGRGYSNREIGEALFISEGTAKNYVSVLIEKLGLRDRTQVALWAVRHGFSH
jgi:DNA-binding NarL/FixJ family response regulator